MMISRLRRHITPGDAVVATLIGLYILIFSVFSIGRYERYNATGFDQGIFTQLTWNASRGQPLQTTVLHYDNVLTEHALYITVLLAPLLWLWPDPRMLLIAQTVVLALGAWPIARLAGRYFAERWVPPLFAGLWLLYPSVGWINRWDIHELAFVATFLAFAFEAADRRTWRNVDLWLVLALLCKEEVGLNVALFSLYSAWRFGRSRRSALLWAVIGVGWFAVHGFIIIPTLWYNASHAPGLPFAGRYTWLFSGDPAAMWAYLSGPDTLLKIAFLVKVLAPVAFVALLAPRPLIVVMSSLALALLSQWQAQFDIYMHYAAPYIPAILTASVYGAARLRSLLDQRSSPGLRITAGAMLAATLLMWMVYNPIFFTPSIPGQTINGWQPGAHIEPLNEARMLIPPEACVVTENNIEPHYTMRAESYVVGVRGDMDGCMYMLIDLDDPRYDDFTSGQGVACYQFWSQKRTPIYFRDSVVVLQQMPTTPNAEAFNQMGAYCDGYAKGQKK